MNKARLQISIDDDEKKDEEEETKATEEDDLNEREPSKEPEGEDIDPKMSPESIKETKTK